MRNIFQFVIVLFLLIMSAQTGSAHQFQTFTLEINEIDHGQYNVTFKAPLYKGKLMKVFPAFPENCRQLNEPSSMLFTNSFISRWMLSCPDGLKGSTIKMEGLSKTLTDSLVILNWADGSSQNYILKAAESSLVIPTQPSNIKVVWDYLVLGVEHILGGIDHLLFVLGLLMIVSGRWLLIKTITAFTVAHSITLGLATLGFVNVPQTPVEAVIALSILFLAVEIIKKIEGKTSIAHRLPWIVAFVFGLLHGIGFAGALTQIGLPQSSIPLALLFFNVGVELGQLMFITVVLLTLVGIKRIKFSLPQWTYKMPAYGIGSMAAFWCIERIIAFL